MTCESGEAPSQTRTWSDTPRVAQPSSGDDGAALPRGSQLGRYVVLERIGMGGMGVVYAAYDPELDRRVAVKVMHHDGKDDTSLGRSRMLREAQAMARLSHPNVVAVHDVGTVGDRVFIAMEFVEGVTLGAWIGERAHVWRDVLAVLVPVGRALEAIHAVGVVHRDVKPDNIMVGSDGRVRLMDLGLAGHDEGVAGGAEALRSTGDDAIGASEGSLAGLTRPGFGAGTPAYMAPEQHVRGRADALSDQFSFCVTLYEALCQQRPFEGSSLLELALNVLEGNVRAVPRDTDAPAWLRQVVLRGLAVEPSERFEDMSALLMELTRDRRRRRLGLLGGAAAVALVGVAGVSRPWADDDDACRDADAAMVALWNDGGRKNVQQALAGTDVAWAEDTTERSLQLIDEYASRWSTLQRETCAAEGDDSTRSRTWLELRAACLDERLSELRALLDVLVDADREVLQHAVQAATALTPVGVCRDEDYLEARQQPWTDPGLGGRLAQVRQQVEHARALRRAGKYIDGLAPAHAAVEDAQRLGQRPLLAEARHELGAIQNAIGDFAGAEQSLTASFVDARWSRHDSIAVESAALLTYVVGVKQARPDEAMVWAQIAEAELGPTGQKSDAHAGLLNNLGNMWLGSDEPEAALDAFERAIAIASHLHGPDHISVAKFRGNQLPALSAVGRIEEAVDAGREALRVNREQLGPAHPNTAVAHNNLCGAIYRAGRRREATECFLEALAAHEQAYGGENPQVAVARNNVGAMLHLLGRDDEAYDHLRRAKEPIVAAFPAQHRNVVAVAVNLALCTHALGRNEEALEHAREALALRIRASGEDHELVADAGADLGDILSALGRHAEAVAELRRALALSNARRGADAPASARMRARLGLALEAAGRGADAEPELTAALSVLDRESPDHFVTGRAHMGLARLWQHRRLEDAKAEAARARDAFASSGALGREGLAEANAWLASHTSD